MAPGSGATQPIRRLDSLTSLRAFAALAVFTCHVSIQLFPWNSTIGSHLTIQGRSGVSFFFILSGVVLTWSRSTKAGVRTFYRRRAARILPGYYIAAALGIVVLLWTPMQFHSQAISDTGPSWLLMQAWVPSQDVYFAGNGVLWSLSCEAFFYALFPLICRRLAQQSVKSIRLVVLGCLAWTCLWPAALHPSGPDTWQAWAIYILPLARLPEFVAGVGIGLLLVRGERCRISLTTAGLLAVATYLGAGFLPFWANSGTVLCLCWALLIFAAGSVDAKGSPSVLHRRTLLKLGEWSFAFYLLHQLVIKVFWLDTTSHSATYTFCRSVLILAVSVAAAATLFTFVERPLDKRLRGEGNASRVPTIPAARARPEDEAMRSEDHYEANDVHR